MEKSLKSNNKKKRKTKCYGFSKKETKERTNETKIYEILCFVFGFCFGFFGKRIVRRNSKQKNRKTVGTDKITKSTDKILTY